MGHGFAINTKGAVRIQGIEIVNCVSRSTAGGGGIYVEAARTLEVVDCNLTSCTADNGGGILVEDANVTLENVRIQNCSAESGSGGGLALLLPTGGHATITNCTLEANTAQTDGGGMILAGGSFQVQNTVLRRNSATNGGGGTVLVGGWCLLVLVGAVCVALLLAVASVLANANMCVF